MSLESITAAGNVEVPAYLALQELGFAIDRRFLENGTEMWVATSDAFLFSAPSPLELLGLCLMRQTRGPNWKADNNQINGYLSTYYPAALDESQDANS
ncbi:hypothetical protein [Prosthecobacter fluviatilis]|uniref:Uncharacterized protein n=1 Tax=Prosthecobacter fluviatilis TaxID=445931 RepID=A0ABW0KW83_9BACT